MKTVLTSILLCCASQLFGMSIDSSRWPFPDTTRLQFTIYGDVRRYFFQFEPSGKPYPDNFDYTYPDAIELDPLIISRIDGNWEPMDSQQVVKYTYNKSQTYIVEERSAAIKLDTNLHRIVSLYYHYRHGSVPSEMYEAEITISGLAYSSNGFSVIDSEAKNSIISASYSYRFGAHSDRYSGVSCSGVTAIYVTGSLNYNILSVKPQVSSINDQWSITQKDQKIWVTVGQDDRTTDLYLYSITGQLIEKIPIQNSQASFEGQNLHSGLYLIRGNRQSAKIFIP